MAGQPRKPTLDPSFAVVLICRARTPTLRRAIAPRRSDNPILATLSARKLARHFDASRQAQVCRIAETSATIALFPFCSLCSGAETTMRRIFWVIALGGLMLGNSAWSQECSLSIDGNDQIQFNKKELRVSKSCKEVTVTLKHVGQLAANVMGHNWVLAATADYQAVATAGQAAGPPNYVPAGDARVLATTTVIGGGQETSVKFDLSKLTPGGDYTYFCSFPGHFVLMNGKLIVE
jgi:azurin